MLDELRYYYGALVLISHDRSVLDELVTTIWEVHEGKVRIYSGNYSDYMAQKKLEREQQSQAHEQFIKKKSRLEKQHKKNEESWKSCTSRSIVKKMRMQSRISPL